MPGALVTSVLLLVTRGRFVTALFESASNGESVPGLEQADNVLRAQTGPGDEDRIVWERKKSRRAFRLWEATRSYYHAAMSLSSGV